MEVLLFLCSLLLVTLKKLVSDSFKALVQLMCLADLEFDYTNPYDSASRINQMVLPEFITQISQSNYWTLVYVSVEYYNVTL